MAAMFTFTLLFTSAERSDHDYISDTKYLLHINKPCNRKVPAQMFEVVEELCQVPAYFENPVA